MSRIGEIQSLVRNGFYYFTEHADDEAMIDGFDVYDVEHGILTGRIRKSWPREGKYEVIGSALDGRIIDSVCRITMTRKVRIITVYEDNPLDIPSDSQFLMFPLSYYKVSFGTRSCLSQWVRCLREKFQPMIPRLRTLCASRLTPPYPEYQAPLSTLPPPGSNKRVTCFK